jgi:hypothetical protein
MIERPVGGISDMLEFALSESIKQSYEEFLLWTFADPPHCRSSYHGTPQMPEFSWTEKRMQQITLFVVA